ncbi:MAG: hypothetical protein ACOY94_22255 [Bacillota bacterium]
MFTFDEGQVLGTVSLDRSTLTPIVSQREGFYASQPILDGSAFLFDRVGPGTAGQWLKEGNQEPRLLVQGPYRHVSPDGTRLVSYSPQGTIFVDLRTGSRHVMDTPGDVGRMAAVLNSWSADGRRFLVQAGRDNPVPGFHFFDQQGRPAGNFAEPGFYSMWATWSPDARYVAFLSIPIDVTYPSGEGMFEPAVAPRLGLLDVESGKASYISVEGLVAAGPLLWSPDGRHVAVRLGRLATENHMARILEESVYVVEPSPNQLHRVAGPAAASTGGYLTVESWAPDGRSLLIRSVRQGQEERYSVVHLGDGHTSEIPGEAVWIDFRRLAAVERGEAPHYGQTLHLVDDRGEVLSTVVAGTRIAFLTPHPAGTHLAFMVDTWKGTRKLGDPPATYLYVVRTDRP